MEAFHQGKPIGDRHDKVHQGEGELWVALLENESFLSRQRGFGGVAFLYEELAQGCGQLGVVVHHEDGGPFGRSRLHAGASLVD